MNIKAIETMKETKSSFLSLSLPVERKMGKVHSVFKTSFNVMIDETLVNFSQQGMSLSAHGCLLDNQTMNQLLDACKPGDLVRLTDGQVFSFYTTKGILKVDLSKMTEIDLSIPKITLPLSDIPDTNVYSVLDLMSFEQLIGLETEGQAQEAFEVLRTLPNRSEQEIKENVKFLIGRGKGLTPSGDDILGGFTMMRKAFLENDAFELILKEAIQKRSTTDISKAYYEGIITGFISSLFGTLIEALENTNEVEVQELIRLIGKYGHTSGYDTLFGMYLGLQSLIIQMEE